MVEVVEAVAKKELIDGSETNLHHHAGGSGSGDMTKAVYDPDSDGKIADAQLTSGADLDDAIAKKHNNSLDHSHTNKTILDAIQEAFTTALKSSYDWLVTNITSAWKITVDSAISLAHSNSLDHNGTTQDTALTTHAALSHGYDTSYFRKVSVTNYEAWYTSPKAGSALAGTALVANRIYAMPFICPKAITLDRIGVYVSTLSTLTARLGIYVNSGLYPGALVLDAGTIDVTSTGAKTITISQALSANTLYWLVIVCAATPAIYCIPVAGVINALGHASALGTAQYAGLYVSLTYGTLPSTFPSSPTMITAAPIPAIFVRLST